MLAAWVFSEETINTNHFLFNVINVEAFPNNWKDEKHPTKYQNVKLPLAVISTCVTRLQTHSHST